MAQLSESKRVHTIILDTSPILLNTPSISTLRSICVTIATTPNVVSEIRGEEARTRFETLYKPFIEIRTPKSESIKFVREFARRTGDLAVLSAPDIEVLALAYDLECERNGGDWRLRNQPGQRRMNGPKTPKETQEGEYQTEAVDGGKDEGITTDLVSDQSGSTPDDTKSASETQTHNEENSDQNGVVPDLGFVHLSVTEPVQNSEEVEEDSEESEDSDGGWITPSNIKRRQAQEVGTSSSKEEGKMLQVATMTGDFAMQNVLLQMNLNLLSSHTCKRIAHIRQTLFRCHACFQLTKDMTKQFCPRCGKPTLTRVTCTTNDKGEVKVHLKQNFQWNKRGNVFSVPKPTSGSANQKWGGPQAGGGQGGWGNSLVFAEDQKEYVRAVSKANRTKQRDLMDQDFLPDFVTGDRNQNRDRIQIGAGRNINSRKR